MLHQAVMAVLTDRIESATQWDAEPVLFLIHMQGRHAVLKPLTVPPYAWSMPGGPAAALEALSLAMARRYPAPPPPGRDGAVHGVAFLYEGWSVITDPGDHHGNRRVSAMLAQRRLSEHPDRVEIRSVVAVDRSGTTYEATHQRGAIGTHQRIQFRDETGVEASGIIVDALDRLVEVLTGAPAQKRPDATIPQQGDLN